MQTSVIERLVCPGEHAPTALVVRADELRDGRLWRGAAGCPVCLKEATIANGVVRFGAPHARLAASADLDAPRLAAYLSLTEPDVMVLADGLPSTVSAALVSDYAARIIEFDGDAGPHVAAPIHGAARVPLPRGAAGAAVLLRTGRDPAFTASVVQALRARGRCVGAIDTDLPDGLSELARDAQCWVAERDADPARVTLQRAPR